MISQNCQFNILPNICLCAHFWGNYPSKWWTQNKTLFEKVDSLFYWNELKILHHFVHSAQKSFNSFRCGSITKNWNMRLYRKNKISFWQNTLWNMTSNNKKVWSMVLVHVCVMLHFKYVKICKRKNIQAVFWRNVHTSPSDAFFPFRFPCKKQKSHTHKLSVNIKIAQYVSAVSLLRPHVY